MNSILLSDAAAAATEQGAITSSIWSMVVWVLVMVVVFYFLMIKPQKKEQKRMSEMLASLENGDVVLTKAGFYGVIIDITDDDVIVEFGSNKNCRIPMQKSAIVQVEKAE